MARKSIEDRLSQLDAQRQALKARLIKEERAKDTRRKILLGALVLERLSGDQKSDEPLRDWLRAALPGYLTRPDDKALFPELLKSAPAAGAAGADTLAPDPEEPGQADLLATREADA